MQEEGVSKVTVDQLSSLINAVYEGINQQLNTHILKRETPPPPAQKPNDNDEEQDNDDGEKGPEAPPQTPTVDEEIGEKRDETSTFSSPVEEGVELTEESLVRKTHLLMFN